jgi:predicted MFS family arabinose efflux permease
MMQMRLYHPAHPFPPLPDTRAADACAPMPALIVALSLAGFIVVACMRLSDPLLPVVAAEFGVSVGQAGIIGTAYAIAYGLFLLAYGPLGDRYGKLRIIAVTLSVAAFCVTACAFADSLAALAALRFLTGVASAATVPLALAWIGDNVRMEIRQATIARYMSGIIFGQMLGSALGGVMSDWLGWRSIFLVFGAATALAAALIWRYPHLETLPLAPPAPLRQAGARYLELLRDRKAADLLTTALIEGFCVFGGIAFVGAMLHERHGLSMSLVGLCLLAYGIGGLAYSAAAPALLRLLGQRGLIAAGGVLMAWSFIVLATAGHWLACACALTVLGFGFYLMHSTLQTLATELIPAARGTAFALFAFALFAGQALGVAAVGAIVDAEGYTMALGAVGLGIGLLGLWMQGSPMVPRRVVR